MRVPKMLPELFDAVHYFFEDDPEIEVDLLVYLAHLGEDKHELAKIGMSAEHELMEKGRCPKCGCPMEYTTQKEWHSEVGGYEPMTIEFCPQCDRGDD